MLTGWKGPMGRVILQKLTIVPQLVILWNTEIHYHSHDRLPLVPTLCQFNPVSTPTSDLRSILILPQSTPRSPDGLFPSGFPHKSCLYFSSPPYVPHIQMWKCKETLCCQWTMAISYPEPDGHVHWNNLAQDRENWRASVNKVEDPSGFIKCECFLD